MYSLRLITPPAAEPVDLADATQHTRSVEDDDNLVTGLISAARTYVESATNRALITQTWEMGLEDWPRGDRIKLTRSPVQAVVSITYKDTLNNITTLVQDTDYIVDTAIEPAEIVLPYTRIWPSTVLQTASPIKVQFRAGYGDTSDAVPGPIKVAMLMLITHWYDNRDAVIVGKTATVTTPVSMAVDAMLAPYRLYTF